MQGQHNQQAHQYNAVPHPTSCPTSPPITGSSFHTNLFGVVISARPVQTAFQQMGPTQWMTEIANPGVVPDVTFFIMPDALISVPEGQGFILYYSVPPSQNWQVLGTLTRQKPSGIFRTGWPTMSNIVGVPTIQLGVSIDTIDTVQNLENNAESGLEERKNFGLKIAQDLFRFMSSFRTDTGSPEMLVVPNNIFDRWISRFEAKYKRDPNFMLRQSD